jgi:hypothetical protein
MASWYAGNALRKHIIRLRRDGMEKKEFKGKLEVWGIQPKRSGDGEFVKLRINGKQFNLFDMELFGQVKPEMKIGQDISVLYTDSTWEFNGKQQVSHVIEDIAFTPEGAKKLEDFSKATEVERPKEYDLDIMMNNCVRIAMDIAEKYKNDNGDSFFSSDNVTSMANSMFIESNKRIR